VTLCMYKLTSLLGDYAHYLPHFLSAITTKGSSFA
jgi:hypothetical protein